MEGVEEIQQAPTRDQESTQPRREFTLAITSLPKGIDIDHMGPNSTTLQGQEKENNKSVRELLTTMEFLIEGKLVPSPFHEVELIER